MPGPPQPHTNHPVPDFGFWIGRAQAAGPKSSRVMNEQQFKDRTKDGALRVIETSGA